MEEADDEAALAQHLSECGWLGTAWLELLPNRAHRLDADSFIMALALMLRLPLAGGDAEQREFTSRHNTFGRRAAGVVCSLPPKGGVKIIRGLPLSSHGLSLGFRPHTRADGTVEQHEVFADTTFRGLQGKSPAWEGHIDYTVVDPCAPTYRARASQQPLHTAGLAYNRKKNHYSHPGLLQPHQELFIFAAEVWGGLHSETHEQLKSWAHEFAPQGVAARWREVSRLLQAWRAELSLGLLEARVGSVYAARAKQRKAALLEQGVTEEQLQRQIPIYRVCTTRSVLDQYSQVARAGHSFWRMLGAV